MVIRVPALRAASAVSLFSLAFAAPCSAQFTAGDVYVASWANKVFKVDPATWTVTTFADATDGLAGPSALVWNEATDRLLVSSFSNSKLFSFDSAGTGTTLYTSTNGLSGPFGQNGLLTTVDGDLYLSNFTKQEILFFPVAGGPATVFADKNDGLKHADGLGFDRCKNLWVADRDGYDLWKVTPAGVATKFDTLKNQVMSIALRPNGDLYVACLYGDLFRYVGGDVTKKTLLLGFGQTLATPVIRFDLDYTKLYYTSSGLGNLLEVDPDTGVTTQRLANGSLGSPLGLEVTGVRRDIGFKPFGSGLAGTGGIMPSLHASGHPVIDHDVTLELRNFIGGGLATVITGDQEGSGPFHGGIGYVDLSHSPIFSTITLPGVAGVPGDGDLDITTTIANDPALDCIDFYVQVICVDLYQPAGFSPSNGLRVTTRSY